MEIQILAVLSAGTEVREIEQEHRAAGQKEGTLLQLESHQEFVAVPAIAWQVKREPGGK